MINLFCTFPFAIVRHILDMIVTNNVTKPYLVLPNGKKSLKQKNSLALRAQSYQNIEVNTINYGNYGF